MEFVSPVMVTDMATEIGNWPFRNKFGRNLIDENDHYTTY